MRDSLPELQQLEALIQRGGRFLRAERLASVDVDGRALPIYCLELGPRDDDLPALGLFGGVHGAERIGTQVVLAYLSKLIERLHWSAAARLQLAHVRLVAMPLVNPGGMLRGTRCTPSGVDLMRNAPLEAEAEVPWLLGGHRLSPRLPWYRGPRHAPMEPEAQVLCRVVRERLLNGPFSIALDCHSGFGMRDRVWFPYARSRAPFPHLAETWRLREIFQRTYPNHRYYAMEPQAHSYTTHGDLWDYLYDQARLETASTLLPLTLEMGSWLWVKKNPRQLLNPLGMFNPMLPHRQERVLRRHLHLIDFLLEVATSWRECMPTGEARQQMMRAALAHWYPGRAS